MKKTIMRRTFAVLFVLSVCLVSAYPQNDGDDIVIGKYRKLHSSVTNEDRTLLVWLPRSYNETTLSYPVIYLLYGQHTSQYLMPVISACDMLATSGVVPEMIVVGVASAERYRDYSSISDGYINITVDFFANELFPFIDSNYRTLDYRIVIGPQAGAVFSFYTLLSQPDLFNAYIMDNPFVNPNREILQSMADSCFDKILTLKKFLYIREENDHNPVNIKFASEFAEKLKTKTPDGFRFFFDLDEPSGYFVPPVPVKEALTKLFISYSFPDSMNVQNVNDIIDFYRDASNNIGVDLPASEHVLTIESGKLSSAGKYSELSAVLEYMLTLFPRSLNAHLQMGDLKRTLGYYESAIKHYDEFLKIRAVDAIAIRNRKESIEKYIYGSLIYALEKDIETKGIDRAISDFKKAKESGENQLTYLENDFNLLGYRLLNRGMKAESIKVFKLAIENYPQSANLYDSLGEAFMNNGDTRNAIRSYEKSLQLNPGNIDAANKLKQIKK